MTLIKYARNHVNMNISAKHHPAVRGKMTNPENCTVPENICLSIHKLPSPKYLTLYPLL